MKTIMRSAFLIASSFGCMAADLSGLRIGIDPGHGGPDSGTVAPAPYNNLTEAMVSLQTAQAAKKYLERDHASVFMTRVDASGPDFPTRLSVYVSNRVNLGVSLHRNAPGSSNNTDGFVYCTSCAQPASVAALNILGELHNNFGFTLDPNPSSKTSPPADDLRCPVDMSGRPVSVTTQSFHCGPNGLGRFNAFMVREPTFKGINANLIEVSYLSNLTEAINLLNPDYVDRQGYAIYAGIVEYLGKTPTPRNQSPPPDFKITAAPGFQSLVQGNSVSFSIGVQSLGLNDFVNLAVSGMPANLQYGSGINNGANFNNIIALFVPSNSTAAARLSIFTSTATPPGSYQISLTGRYGNVVHTATVALTVNPPPRGTIQVNAHLNGNQSWSGPVNCRLNGPAGSSISWLPATFNNIPTGMYSLTCSSGGPGPLTGINPSSLSLGAGQTQTFIVNYQSLPPTPVLSRITTSPAPPIHGKPFNFTVFGGGFDPTSVMITFTGPGCPNGCPLQNGSLSSKSSGQFSGAAVLAAGTFTITVNNGNVRGTNTLSLKIN